ncbi:MAG: PD-(D/E)XK nuclease family protein, partial [Bacteroidetes bacterium]|nr:PD-(D/E)XK nuclease family protein [Bacteroidota bacterium]
MKYFLEQVADQLYESYGDSLGRHTIVFPGRRAGVFLMKHLSAIAGKPLWAPRTITINELFAACSRLTVAPAEQLVFELYRIYRQLSGSSETFDNFYFWGEMLLGDFDDIDKNLVDARALFTNISDLHRIDEQFGGLTPEQVEIIR